MTELERQVAKILRAGFVRARSAPRLDGDGTPGLLDCVVIAREVIDAVQNKKPEQRG